MRGSRQTATILPGAEASSGIAKGPSEGLDLASTKSGVSGMLTIGATKPAVKTAAASSRMVIIIRVGLCGWFCDRLACRRAAVVDTSGVATI